MRWIRKNEVIRSRLLDNVTGRAICAPVGSLGRRQTECQPGRTMLSARRQRTRPGRSGRRYPASELAQRRRHVPPLDPIPAFDLYAELAIAPGADAATIERAWRAGVRSVHPDRALIGQERAATQRTARLNIAREWLMDPSKRARYDELRRPSPKVEIPYIDPLGAWPERPRTRARARAEARRRGRSGFFSQRPVMVALATLVIAQVYGIDANPLMFSVVALAVVVLGWYVWFAVVGVLVGAWFRWRGG